MRRQAALILLIAVALMAAAYLFLRPGRERPVEERRLTLSRALGGAPSEGFLRAAEPRPFVFPADHRPHPGFRTEWWYFTGNLRTAEGRHFGYQLTFFRFALAPRPVARESRWGANELFMAHFALTDTAGRRFHHAERLARGALGLAGAGEAPLRLWAEDWEAAETSALPWAMRLSAREGDAAIDLDLRGLKPVVLNGEKGLSRKGREPGNASYYYSLPRIETAGSVRIGGRTFAVQGTSWLDREWGTNVLGPDLEGWDWFALQLDDGRDLMLYRLRRHDGTAVPFSSGTLVAVDGNYRSLAPDEVNLDILDRWRSPASGVLYPSRWRLRVPAVGLDLEIVPRLPEQELRATIRYWEGAVAVRGLSPGSPGGVGYAELTGYGESGASGN